jgi:hypothetical protein
MIQFWLLDQGLQSLGQRLGIGGVLHRYRVTLQAPIWRSKWRLNKAMRMGVIQCRPSKQDDVVLLGPHGWLTLQ